MLESKASQFTLSPEGKILWQEKPNNPLPGQEVARLEKGAHILTPSICIVENDTTQAQDKEALQGHLNIWLKSYMKEVVEPLVMLEVPKGADVKDDAVSRIASVIYDNLGIVPREDIEDIIADLTPETRVDLRAKKIRLGPVLAFIPSLNKPAAVRLRALLWSLFHDVALPALVPADGIVSTRIEDDDANAHFYRSIGYPLYGGRAVRIDMLDRVISCVYDHADKGKFQARHEMAEWLGCTIEDLYKILEAMGHTKAYDPADNVEDQDGGNTSEGDSADQTSVSQESVSQEASEKAEQTAEPETDDKNENVQDRTRPELATFRLKRGKAFEKSGKGGGRNKAFKNSDQGDRQKKKGDYSKNKKHKPHKKGKGDKGPRIISLEAKKQAEDSPFAILQQLKK
ncbi:MAG: hypothetical protein ACRBDL_02390 [Alphaproteobacteria bacterium]